MTREIIQKHLNKPVICTKIKKAGPPQRHYTQAEKDFIILHYEERKTQVIARIIGRSLCGIYGQAQIAGLQKSSEAKKKHGGSFRKGRSSNPAGQFVAGSKPWNKGTKGVMKKNKGSFKAGHSPYNTVPVGSISYQKDNTGKRYKRVKIAMPNVWAYAHHLVWMGAHGPLPDANMIIFKDGDTENLHLENLECIHMGENMLRNTVHRYPEELKNAMILSGKLKAKIKKYLNKNHSKDEKHNA